VYGSCRAEEVGTFINRLTKCVDDVALWVRSTRLQKNAGKTEYMWFTTPRRIQQLPAGAITIVGHDLLPVFSYQSRRVLRLETSVLFRPGNTGEPANSQDGLMVSMWSRLAYLDIDVTLYQPYETSVYASVFGCHRFVYDRVSSSLRGDFALMREVRRCATFMYDAR
jgi:hypothetical protein